MTRKDFELIAATLKEGTTYGIYRDSADCRSQHALMCNDFSYNLRKTNPNFDRVRFLKACGLSEETIDAL